MSLARKLYADGSTLPPTPRPRFCSIWRKPSASSAPRIAKPRSITMSATDQRRSAADREEVAVHIAEMRGCVNAAATIALRQFFSDKS